MTTGALVHDGGGEGRLTGVLSLENVPELRRQGVAWIRGCRDSCSIDLSDAEFAGSAGVALLVAWLREARQTGKQLTYRNPPPRLVRIARVCGTAGMLALDGEESRDRAAGGGQSR